jgi:hypothetical protein
MLKFSKLIKTIILIPLIAVLLIFAVLLITPLLFKDQLMNLARTELNKMLSAKVDFKDLKISFIRNFPNAYIGLDGLEVIGIDDFDGELLVAFDRFSVTVDIMSVIKMDNIEVKSILLDRARLNGIILEDGRANWNIMKGGEVSEATEEDKEEVKKEETEKKESEPFKFKVGLSKFEIRDMEANFRDDAHKMNAGIQTFNFNLRGNMKKENVDLNMKLAIDGIDFWMNGARLANKLSVGFVSEIAADLKNMRFTIKDNKFNLNDIVLKFFGTVELSGSDIITDVSFATDKTEFKSLLSLVPAIYMNDFKELRTKGDLSLSGDVKGTYSEKQMPIANVRLSVDDAMFYYPSVPKSVEKINIAVRAHYDGEVFDRTTADVDRFSFEIAGNPFNAEVHVKTPESDLEVGAKFAGKIDIVSITDIIPMDDTTLNGLLECNISLAGKLSTLQKQQYEDFDAAGYLKLTGFDFLSPAFVQGAKITSMLLNFNPRRVELANLNVITGSSDIALNGSLENFIPFVLKNETIKGNLVLKSNNINLNEIMGGEKKEKEEKVKEESGPLNVIEVPKNIDFAVIVDINNILFDKLSITNTKGAITVKDGKLVMNNLGMNMLEGSIILNGEYNTQAIAIPFINFDMSINQFDITSALSSFAFLEKILPEPQNYAGKVSAVMTLYSVLDAHMSPVLDSMNSKGRLQTHNLQIRNSKLFGTLADLTRNENFRTPSPGNLNIGFEIKDGRLYLEDPIIFDIPPAKMEITGDQGLDMTLNYKISASMPASTVGAADLLSKLPGGSGIKEVKLSGAIRGNAKNPEVSLSLADMTSSITDAVKDQVTQKVEDVKAVVNEEINRQIDQIMAEANRQADIIRSTGKQAANKVREEANAAADRLISNAGSNPLQKKLAQEGAGKLRSEGESNAKKVEKDADTQAKAVVAAAQKKADELKRK